MDRLSKQLTTSAPPTHAGDEDREFARMFNTRFFVEDYITDSVIPDENGSTKGYKHNPETVLAYFMHP